MLGGGVVLAIIAYAIVQLLLLRSRNARAVGACEGDGVTTLMPLELQPSSLKDVLRMMFRRYLPPCAEYEKSSSLYAAGTSCYVTLWQGMLDAIVTPAAKYRAHDYE
jgi:hypothetical protein